MFRSQPVYIKCRINYRNAWFYCISLFCFLFPLLSYPDVDPDSIFREARKPASMLDVELAIIQRTWWTTYVLHPDEELKSKFPIITSTGIGIELSYSSNDVIHAKGIITNENAFLRLTQEQKKLLLRNTLRNIRGHLLNAGVLVDKKSGKETGRIVENRQIKLYIVFDSVTKNTNNQVLNIKLPHNAGIGMAGYSNGFFIYSKPYYMDLKLIKNMAITGDETAFVIEPE